jgi:signal transduction histidine kinase
VALMESRAKEKSIDLSFSLKDLKPVQADPKNIEEILNNLISNAINYSPEGGNVTVAIVKGIVDAHQGTIDVESIVDKGTVFKILLPMITE